MAETKPENDIENIANKDILELINHERVIQERSNRLSVNIPSELEKDSNALTVVII
jgi:hypothetical protein